MTALAPLCTMIGQTLGHYRILDQLGAGGMGEVYLAEDTKLHRKIALKILSPALAASPERLERFEREARTLAALDHPHIVTIYSVEEVDGLRFLTMAYVEGQTLAEVIPGEGLAVERWLALAEALAAGLGAAHERGIVHGDLKPGNVMVDRAGRLRILDFGLAKLQPEVLPGHSQLPTETGSPAMTREGASLGTYPYMAPEQAEGVPVDARADIFSLGTMLYEMATGWRPFRGATPAALISSILRDAPRPVRERRPELPAGLGRLVERCLQKDPAARYQSAQDLRDALAEVRREVVAGETVVSRPVGWPRRGAMPRTLILAALVVLALLAGVWAWMALRFPPGAEAPRIDSLAVLPLQNLSGDPAEDYFVDGMTEALITDLSKIGSLTVISRTSAMRYKGTDRPLEKVARELGVDVIVAGSVLREGDRVGITAQLVDASTERNLWAERYERDLTSILALQGEIARTIAREIEVTLTPEEQTLLASAKKVDPAAYEAVLKGRHHIHRFTPQDFETAMQYFQAALKVDPEYAAAHVGMARVWAFGIQAGTTPPDEAGPRAKAAVLKALELDDTLAEAHMALAGITAWAEWNWEGAERGFRRVFEIDPNYAEARIFYSHLLTILGRTDEGTAQAELALRLDPFNPFFQGLYGVQLVLAGRYEDGIAQLRQTVRQAPGLGFGHQSLWAALHHEGRHEEALSALKDHFRLQVDDSEVVQALDDGYVKAGYGGALRRAAETLERRSRTGYVRSIFVARLWDAAGDIDKALEWLGRAFTERDSGLPYAGKHPHSDALRSDPRFQDLLRRMNLPL